ncbi:MAG TPA: hypothetical protein DEQ61_07380, partial [Streptomyces sp.]|nr:hypothetical protein [Streptomyces sp.]
SGTGGGEEGTAPASEADGEGAGGGGLPPYTNALRTALAAARHRPVTPYYAAFTELVQTEVHTSLNNGTGGGPLAAELDKGLRRVMRGG